MGRKVNPIGMRLKVIRDWDARWYAEGDRFVELLHEDLELRKYVKEQTSKAGVSRIEIERQPNVVAINIHTVRPGLIIGRKGEEVKKLRETLQAKTGKTVKVEVTEIEKPDLDPHAGGGERCWPVGAPHWPQPRHEARCAAGYAHGCGRRAD